MANRVSRMGNLTILSARKDNTAGEIGVHVQELVPKEVLLCMQLTLLSTGGKTNPNVLESI